MAIIAEDKTSARSNTEIKVSVRDLLEFCARKGDLISENQGPTALEGILGHQREQQKRTPDWQKEVPLKHTFNIGKTKLTLQGRADLINTTSLPPIVEELKTSYIAAQDMEESTLAYYWAQAAVYGALFGLTTTSAAETIELKITVLNLSDKTKTSFSRKAHFTELRQQTELYVAQYIEWIHPVLHHLEHRNSSAEQLGQPYELYREGQHALAKFAYQSINRGHHGLFEAPTGLGKTMAMLFPAIKFFATQKLRNIVYLTCKTATQDEPKKSIDHLKQQGLAVKEMTLCAKQKLCFCATKEEQIPCPYTIGYFDRLPEARKDAYSRSRLDKEDWLELGEKHQICPFSLSLEMTNWFDIVIADVNYFFDPLVKLSGFHSSPKKTAVLIDEAHNLIERSNDMYSGTIHSQDFAQLTQHRMSSRPTFKNTCRSIESLLQQPPEEPISGLNDLIPLLQKCLNDLFAHAPEPDLFQAGLELTEITKRIIRFLVIYELHADAHHLITQRSTQPCENTTLTLQCVAAKSYLKSLLKPFNKVIGFSATLQPMDYYQEFLGLHSDTTKLTFPSPFASDNLQVIRCDFLNTRYQHRAASLPQLIELVHVVTETKKGNYIVFFPSFEYLNTFYEAYQSRLQPSYTLLAQTANASKEEQKQFLDAFFTQSQPTLGLAVIGGSFAEGVDYVGSSLIGSIIVSVAMTPPSKNLQFTQAWLKQSGRNPYLYSQLYPSICKITQAAGRVIRSEKDRGIVILADDRFQRPEYHPLLPSHWQIEACDDLHQCQQHLQRFWSPKK